jgi:uncharacterized protein (DUF433 family)
VGVTHDPPSVFLLGRGTIKTEIGKTKGRSRKLEKGKRGDNDFFIRFHVHDIIRGVMERYTKASDVINRIEINPKVCNGKPIVRGTRIPITTIIEQIAEGESWDSILIGYPELHREDIQAALLYATNSLEHTDIKVVGG